MLALRPPSSPRARGDRRRQRAGRRRDQGRAGPRRRRCRARLLGSAAPAGTARPVAHPVIRFLTELDYPPFDYAGPDGNPAGFNVDLARLLCDEINTTCTIQARRFDTAARRAQRQPRRCRHRFDRVDRGYPPHAPISPIPITARRRASSPAPTARSATCCRNWSRARRSRWSPAPRTRLSSKRCSPRPRLHPYPNAEAAREALRNKDVDLLFGDGIALAFWLNGSDSGGCCAFRGGPYLESRFFGEGVGIAVKRGNDLLRQALNWALFRQWEKGSYTDLWLRYFPISPF